MKLVHFVYIPFTGLGMINNGFMGQDWFENRARIFKKYTLASLANQTTKNFIIWISFRPEEKDNPVTEQIRQDIEEAGLKYVFTFNGIAMYDDRGTQHNKDLKERLGKMIETLKPLIGDAEWVFKTDCGSDDMLSSVSIEEIQEEEPRISGATYYLNGFIFNDQTGQVAEWKRNTSCSKYTLMFPVDIFLNPIRHYSYIGKLESHEFLPLVFDATRLPDGRYACAVHGYNISTAWSNPFRGEEYFGKEKQLIIKKFGLNL